MKLASIASTMSDKTDDTPTSKFDDVVEIGILLPANRAADLIRIARARRESVGHMIRKLIDRELELSRCSG